MFDDETTHDQLARYLSGELSFAGLREWFRPVAWNLNDGDFAAANPLMRRVALYFAEYHAGHRTEADLRGLFTVLVRTLRREYRPPRDRVVMGGSGLVSHVTRMPQLVGAGTRRGAVYAR